MFKLKYKFLYLYVVKKFNSYKRLFGIIKIWLLMYNI